MKILKNYDSKVRVRTNKELMVRKNEFLKICFLLDKLKIRYFLQTGILLGAIRHKGFIPWDWDVEISVFANEVIEKMDILVKEIENLGFKIRKSQKELSKLKIDFIGSLPRETTAYTIQGWSHDEKKKIFWRNKFKVPDNLLKNMKKIKLFEKYHLAPDPPEKYLKHQYGNWKKPLQTSDKSIYLTKEFSGISYTKFFFKKILNVLK